MGMRNYHNKLFFAKEVNSNITIVSIIFVGITVVGSTVKLRQYVPSEKEECLFNSTYKPN